MTDEQFEALRLAVELADDGICQNLRAAAELRRLHQSEREGWRYAAELEQERKRLHEVNAELVEALRFLLMDTEHKDHYCGDEKWCPVLRAKAELAKATGENND